MKDKKNETELDNLLRQAGESYRRNVNSLFAGDFKQGTLKLARLEGEAALLSAPVNWIATFWQLLMRPQAIALTAAVLCLFFVNQNRTQDPLILHEAGVDVADDDAAWDWEFADAYEELEEVFAADLDTADIETENSSEYAALDYSDEDFELLEDTFDEYTDTEYL